MRKQDPFEYIRTYYKVPAAKWGIVKVDGKFGVITGADGAHILIRVEGGQERPYHPTSGVEYVTGNQPEAVAA